VSVSPNLNRNEPIQHTVKKLKPDTVYYFKIQVRSNRAYTASSPTIIYRTPNCELNFLKYFFRALILMTFFSIVKGEGGGKIFSPNDHQSDESIVPLKDISKLGSYGAKSVRAEMNIIWIIAASIMSVLFLFILLIGVLVCRRSNKSAKETAAMMRDTKPMMTLSSNKENYASLRKKAMTKTCANNLYDNKITEEESLNESSDMFQQHVLNQQQQMLINNHHQINAAARLSCSTSSQASTLIKPVPPPSNMVPPRTPHHHHQPLIINNPSHMMMNPLSINSVNGQASQNHPATNHSNTLTDFEFYSNMNATVISNNNNGMQQIFSNNSNYNTHNQQQNNAGNLSHIRSVSINEDGMSSQNVDFMNQNGEFSNQFFVSANGNDPAIFMRNVSRPKPIAIPISGPNNTGNGHPSNMSSPIDHHQQQQLQGAFVVSTNTTRKSFRNLRKFCFYKF
jgi:hypothetical protein